MPSDPQIPKGGQKKRLQRRPPGRIQKEEERESKLSAVQGCESVSESRVFLGVATNVATKTQELLNHLPQLQKENSSMDQAFKISHYYLRWHVLIAIENFGFVHFLFSFF